MAGWVQNGRIRVFANGEKQLDFNQVEMPPIDSIEIAHDFYGVSQAIGYRMVRFAESTPDFSQVISSSGCHLSGREGPPDQNEVCFFCHYVWMCQDGRVGRPIRPAIRYRRVKKPDPGIRSGC